ncbi:MAG TPA: peptidoglycan recognition family protein, partial [Pyrinomonadaceae bacterium]
MSISNQVGKVSSKYLNHSHILFAILGLMFCISCSLVSQEPQTTNSNQRHVKQNRVVDQTSLETTSSVPQRPNILSRQEWGAKEAIGKMHVHTLRYITIHHTASPQKDGVTLAKKLQNLQNFSQNENRLDSGKNKPAWPDVPYHYYIAVDGGTAEGRDVGFVGDTNTDYDPRGHVLIALEGNFETEQPTSKQLGSLITLVSWLSAKFKIPGSEIKGHSDYASTACPGVNLKNKLPELREKLTAASARISTKVMHIPHSQVAGTMNARAIRRTAFRFAPLLSLGVGQEMQGQADQ